VQNRKEQIWNALDGRLLFRLNNSITSSPSLRPIREQQGQLVTITSLRFKVNAAT